MPHHTTSLKEMGAATSSDLLLPMKFFPPIVRVFLLLLPLRIISAQEPPEPTWPAPIIDESFEGVIPAFHTFKANYSANDEQANQGTKSLLVTPDVGNAGGVYFRLGDALQPGKTYKFSAFVRVSEGGRASLYISGVENKSRRIFATTSGGQAGKWVKLTGLLRSTDLKGQEQDLMLALVTTSQTYYDDVRLQEVETILPPIVSWPKTLGLLKSAAANNAQQLSIGRNLTLQPRHGALSTNLNREEIRFPTSGNTEIAADGALIFAIDLPAAAVVSGMIQLKHSGDLRPGLRAYVLIDSTLIAAPMVSAEPWSNPGGVINRPAPNLVGRPPSDSFSLTPCTLRAGRHYLIIAGPHTRAAGELVEVILQAAPVKDSPLYTFAFFADTHLADGRSEWMNHKLNGAAADQLKQTLAELRDEWTDFVILGGDMVESGTAPQYAQLQEITLGSKMTIYGVMGNHETFQPTSRADQKKYASNLFPGTETFYELNKAPLRFIALDKSYWRNAAGATREYPGDGFSASSITPEQVDWLKTVLAKDTRTPTIILCHFPLFANPSVSSSGYKLVSWAIADKATELITKAPNVVAVLNGHTHWNQVGKSKNIAWIQNAAFVEWPAMYRVFRVYPDHIEWETRLVSNLGFLRESLIPEKGLSWMISTGPGDLGGRIELP